MNISGIKAQLLSFSFCTICICCSTVLPRAAAIQLFENNENLMLSDTVVVDSGVPDSLTELQQKWLRILGTPAPSIGEGGITCQDLITELRALGLFVVLDETASDEGLSLNEVIELPFQHQALMDRLLHAFAEFNVTITMDSGHVRIISIDNSDDPERHLLVTYDLTGASDIESLVGACEVIDPEQEFLSGMKIFTLKGRQLMSLDAPFSIHLKLRQFFRSIAVHTGTFVDSSNLRTQPVIPSSGRTRLTSVLLSQRLGSTPVAMPAKKVKAGINLSRDGSGSGFGGMGGGTFNVGN